MRMMRARPCAHRSLGILELLLSLDIHTIALGPHTKDLVPLISFSWAWHNPTLNWSKPPFLCTLGQSDAGLRIRIVWSSWGVTGLPKARALHTCFLALLRRCLSLRCQAGEAVAEATRKQQLGLRGNPSQSWVFPSSPSKNGRSIKT